MIGYITLFEKLMRLRCNPDIYQERISTGLTSRITLSFETYGYGNITHWYLQTKIFSDGSKRQYILEEQPSLLESIKHQGEEKIKTKLEKIITIHKQLLKEKMEDPSLEVPSFSGL